MKILLFLTMLFSELALANTINYKVEIPETGKDVRIKVDLWGYNPWLADANASLLRTEYKRASFTKNEFTMVLPEDIYLDIDQGAGKVPKEDASYFLTVVVDINGDSKICAGDLRLDYTRQDPHFISSFPTRVLNFLMTKINHGDADDECKNTSP
ncbi:MAG: hypothetical protein KDD58_13690 [Bdellovibrionales bacterium]|nr:hypothetical protein [Bdellovibrionales bacterium]